MTIENEIKLVKTRRESLQAERLKATNQNPTDPAKIRRFNRRIGALTEKLQVLRAKL